MIEWNIQSRAHACQACQQDFADKQPYFTVLFDHKQGLERLDVCAACWQAQDGQGATERKGFLSFWQGVYTVAPPPPPEPIQKESAESLLRKLMEANDPQHTAACFILAVMLERKKIFKVKAQNYQGNQRTLVYEHARNGDVFTILDPQLQLNQLEQVQREVSLLLEKGLEVITAPADTLSQTATREPPSTTATPDTPSTPDQNPSASQPGPEAANSGSANTTESQPCPTRKN